MVLCEIMAGSSLGFMETWALLTVAAWASLGITSGLPFWYYYMRPTYEKWLWKTNKTYPPPHMVRSEAYKSFRGCVFVTLMPTLALYAAKHGWGHAYCGPRGWLEETAQFAFVFLLVDFFEFYYHRMGHTIDFFWSVHKPHHKYFNPTPWAVIADDALDEIARGSPLFWIPMIMSTNLESLFLQFIITFNIYGTLLHVGWDFPFTPVHGQGILNTPHHHALHHALSINKKPYHTGFFLQIWDRLFGSVYDGPCTCSQCDVKAGNRTREAYDKIEKPDYSVLFEPGYWWNWRDDAADVVKEQ